MIVSVVDLLYVFGRSFFVRMTFPTLVSPLATNMVISSIFGTLDRKHQNTALLYRSFILV